MTSPDAPPPAIIVQPAASPRFLKSCALSAGTHRKVAIAVDLSDESAYAVNWAVQNYLRPDDAVVLLHVRPTSVLYGADWGAVDPHSAGKTNSDENTAGKTKTDENTAVTTTGKTNSDENTAGTLAGKTNTDENTAGNFVGNSNTAGNIAGTTAGNFAGNSNTAGNFAGNSNTVGTTAGKTNTDERSLKKLEDDFDEITATKARDLAKPLIDANINYKIHIVKDHDMKERLCLEVERLGLSAVIMGSRGFGASRRSVKGQRLGSVSDYCVHHCVCPVVVVRYPDDKGLEAAVGSPLRVNGGGDGVLRPVPEEEAEFHDASDSHTDLEKPS